MEENTPTHINIWDKVILPLAFLSTFVAGIILTYVFTTISGWAPFSSTPSNVLIEEYDILIASTSTPRKMLALEVRQRPTQPFGFAHYFDGEKWQNIKLNSSVVQVEEVDSMNQFVNSIKSTFTFGKDTFEVNIPLIYTSMVVRGEKEYVKFGGSTQTPGKYFSINGEEIDSHAALLKGFNRADFDVDLKDIGVRTDWLMYWDENWNFYHLDKTIVLQDHPHYSSHQTFSIASVSEDNFTGAVTYHTPVLTQTTDEIFEVTYSSSEKEEMLTLNKSHAIDYIDSPGEVFETQFVTSPSGGVGYYRLYNSINQEAAVN